MVNLNLSYAPASHSCLQLNTQENTERKTVLIKKIRYFRSTTTPELECPEKFCYFSSLMCVKR